MIRQTRRRRWDVLVQLQSLNLQPDLASHWLKTCSRGASLKVCPPFVNPCFPHPSQVPSWPPNLKAQLITPAAAGPLLMLSSDLCRHLSLCLAPSWCPALREMFTCQSGIIKELSVLLQRSLEITALRQSPCRGPMGESNSSPHQKHPQVLQLSVSPLLENGDNNGCHTGV